MQDFIGDRLPSIQNAILDRSADKATNNLCHCNSGALSLFRCQDCDSNKLACASCLVRDHQHSWFHWGEKWTGTYFEKVDMSTLGLEVQLGHAGERCPNSSQFSVEKIRVVEINGIHSCKVVYCRCHWKHDKYLQLIGSGLFPSSIKKPSLLFTIRLLNDFQIHTHASRKSAYDYIKAIGRKTNDAMPEYVKVRSDTSQTSSRLIQKIVAYFPVYSDRSHLVLSSGTKDKWSAVWT